MRSSLGSGRVCNVCDPFKHGQLAACCGHEPGISALRAVARVVGASRTRSQLSVKHAFRPVVIGKHRSEKHHPRIFPVGDETASRLAACHQLPVVSHTHRRIEEDAAREENLR